MSPVSLLLEGLEVHVADVLDKRNKSNFLAFSFPPPHSIIFLSHTQSADCVSNSPVHV